MVVALYLFALLLVANVDGLNLTLIRGGDVYTPEHKGKVNLLIGGTKILQFTDTNNIPNADIFDATDMIILPGLIDIHMHAAGGGGEAGPASRTPPAQIDQILDAGITSIVGLLGTDGVTRSELNLLQKLNGLEAEGISTYMWAGNYHVPSPTLTGSILQDLVAISKVMGAGEIAISDHRSSVPTYDELSRMAADVRVGGLLSGKAAKLYFHLGNGDEGIDVLWKIVQNTQIPITQLFPTHMTRNEKLVAEGMKWVTAGGNIDVTADSGTGNHTARAILSYYANGISLDRVSVSSDSYGSEPKFDSHGNLVRYIYVKPIVLLNQVRNLVLKYNWPISRAFKLATSNIGKFLGLNKGEIQVGADADILVFNKTSLDLLYVFAKGEILKTPTWTKQPMIPVCDSSE